MNSDEPWVLLRTQRIDDGLQELQQAFDANPTPSHIMELGIAYMWVERYQIARDHFQSAIEQYHGSMSSFYGMAGAANWCLGEFDEAVASWRSGLNAEFKDTAGLGIHLPLLLWFASIVKPSVFETGAAKRILSEKCKDSRIEEWPGPIASWILHNIDYSELLNQCRCESPSETADRHWLSDFYKAVINFEDSTDIDSQNSFLKLTDQSRPEWSDEAFFLARMWSEEFFLARSLQALSGQ
jgi:tetratricopeptide (TPR) repeat protein